MEGIHDRMHGFVVMGGTHISFRDPFVFLLHSNVDRLFALWQTDPEHPERLEPATVYGTEGSNAALNSNVEPWSTGHSIDTFGEEHFIRPWYAPEKEGVPHKYKDPSIALPPRYDTSPGLPLSVRIIAEQCGISLPLSLRQHFFGFADNQTNSLRIQLLWMQQHCGP